VVENSIYARPPDARSPKVWFILIHYVKMMIETVKLQNPMGAGI